MSSPKLWSSESTDSRVRKGEQLEAKGFIIATKKKKKNWRGRRRQPNTSVPKRTTTWPAGQDSNLQSSKVVPGDANARRFRSSSLSLVTWRSWNKMVSRLSPDGRLSLMAGGGEDASPLTGDPATASSVELLNVYLTGLVSVVQYLHGKDMKNFTELHLGAKQVLPGGRGSKCLPFTSYVTC